MRDDYKADNLTIQITPEYYDRIMKMKRKVVKVDVSMEFLGVYVKDEVKFRNGRDIDGDYYAIQYDTLTIMATGREAVCLEVEDAELVQHLNEDEELAYFLYKGKRRFAFQVWYHIK